MFGTRLPPGDPGHGPDTALTAAHRRPTDGLRMGGAWSAGDNSHMDILLNGEKRNAAEGCRVSDLLLAEGLAERRVAVEVNGAIVPRSAHGTHVLRAGD